MSEQQGFRPAPRVKNALDDSKMKLSAPAPTAAGKTASLVFGLINNNPRITVYTQDPSETDERTGYGKIVAKLDQPVMSALFTLIEQVANTPATPEGIKRFLQNKNTTWFGGKPSETPVVINSVVVGKDKDGGVWISLEEQNRPKIKFFIDVPSFHCFYNADGTAFTREQSSRVFALGYVNLIRSVMTELFVSSWVAPEPKKPRQGGGGGGYQNNSGGGYRPQQSQPQRPAPVAENNGGDDFPY